MINEPLTWSIQTLSQLDPDALHELAVRANGTCTAQNLHLGRCLAAIDESELHQSFGCSGAIHYAINFLGMQAHAFREVVALETPASFPTQSRATGDLLACVEHL